MDKVGVERTGSDKICDNTGIERRAQAERAVVPVFRRSPTLVIKAPYFDSLCRVRVVSDIQGIGLSVSVSVQQPDAAALSPENGGSELANSLLHHRSAGLFLDFLLLV